jgi:transposase
MVTMSQKELQRVRVMENAAGGRLSVREASRLLHLSERQVQRLKRRYQPDSIDWVHHGNLGRSMPWAVSPPQKQLILTLARGKYVGFNDSHLTEKLCAEEGLGLSRETVRRILRAAKLASPQKRRPRQYRSRRPPRPRFGMMALADASRHGWLEGRGPELTLIGFQDDATHKILAAHFQLEAENTLGYLFSLRTMILAHGIPLSLYRDRHAIFQRNDAHWTVAEGLAGKQSPTQLGRALEELGIQQIPAYSPQAKGRIERAWRTFQDRLVSELRLAGAATLAQANAVLDRFCADYNQRFARPPPTRFATFAACPAVSISTAASACTISAWSTPITPSPWAHTSSHCPRCPATAATPEKPSNFPINSTALCASFAETLYCGLCPCPSKNTPNAALRRLPRRGKEKLRCPASTTSPAAPLWRPLPKRQRG